MASKASNRATIATVLKQEGFSPMAVAGALGRIRAESAFNPQARRENDAGPGKDSFGIFQWNRDRLTRLKRFAAERGKDWRDVATQAHYFAAEVKGEVGSEGAWGKRLLAATTPEEAAKAAISMARPMGWAESNPAGGHGFKKQLGWTQEYVGVENTADRVMTAVSNEMAAKAAEGPIEGEPEVEAGTGNVAMPDESGVDSVEPVEFTPAQKFEQMMAGIGEAFRKGGERYEKEQKRKGSGHSRLLGGLTEAGPSAKTVDQIIGMVRL